MRALYVKIYINLHQKKKNKNYIIFYFNFAEHVN